MNSRLLAAAVIAIVLAGCSASRSPLLRPSLPEHLTESPLVLHPWNEAGDGALLSGRLLLEEECLYVVSEHSNERWVPSFPYPGTDWDGAAVVSGNEVIAIGELAEFGGGEGDLTAADVEGLDWVKPPDPACLTTGKAWWVYSGSDPP